jgi:hypothetical protein
LTEQRAFKIDKVPKGSRFEKYLTELPGVFKGNKNEILKYLQKMFVECLDFCKQNAGFSYLPQITLKFVTDHTEFKKLEQAESQKAKTKEESKLQATAFTVGNRFAVKIYVDLESFINLLKHGWATFVLNIVETYFHEILHTAFPQKSEQEIHDQQFPLIEKFLGIQLPEEIKNLKASDYYIEKAF